MATTLDIDRKAEGQSQKRLDASRRIQFYFSFSVCAWRWRGRSIIVAYFSRANFKLNAIKMHFALVSVRACTLNALLAPMNFNWIDSLQFVESKCRRIDFMRNEQINIFHRKFSKFSNMQLQKCRMFCGQFLFRWRIEVRRNFLRSERNRKKEKKQEERAREIRWSFEQNGCAHRFIFAASSQVNCASNDSDDSGQIHCVLVARALPHPLHIAGEVNVMWVCERCSARCFTCRTSTAGNNVQLYTKPYDFQWKIVQSAAVQ